MVTSDARIDCSAGRRARSTMSSALIAVTDVRRPAPDGPPYWTVSFYVSAQGARGQLSVPVEYGVFVGENNLKVARNRLRIFSGTLADSTTSYALTDDQILKL